MAARKMTRAQSAWLARASRQSTVLGYSVLPDGRMSVALRLSGGEREVFVVPAYTARDLRVVSNETRDYSGGYTVETGPKDSPTIVAGPFAAEDDARTAKRRLVAGESIAEMKH